VKFETRLLHSVTFLRMYVDNDNVDKSGTLRQATDDNIMLRRID
jgi:hypothetical protein